MTTPLCNDGCSDSVGWLPESNYDSLFPPSTKSTAQPIYCIGGNPKVAPRGLFAANYADAREDSAGTGRVLGSSGTVAGLAGTVPTTLTVTNSTAYPMAVFGLWTGNATLSIVNDWVYTFSTTLYRATPSSPTPTAISGMTATAIEYGVDSLSVNPWRQMKNSAFRYIETLAPGDVVSYTIKTSWQKTSGSDPASSSNQMNSFSSALRIITGNS